MVDTEGRQLLIAYFGREDSRSQAGLSKELGVKPSSLAAWKAGHTRPEVHFRMAIEREIGIPAMAWMTERERLIVQGANDTGAHRAIPDAPASGSTLHDLDKASGE